MSRDPIQVEKTNKFASLIHKSLMDKWFPPIMRFKFVQFWGGLAQWKRFPSGHSCSQVRNLAFPKKFQRKFDVAKVN